jgi:DNA-binding phage protein
MSLKAEQIEKIRAVTVPYQELTRQRIEREPEFAGILLTGAVECLLENDVITAQLRLRNITNCTVGFPALARETGIMEKSLMRMLSVKGNPQARNLCRIINALQGLIDVRLEVRAV